MSINNKVPLVSKELLEYLDKVFPEVVTLDTTENLQYNAGKRAVIHYIKQMHNKSLNKAHA